MPDVDSETKDALWGAWYELSAMHTLPLIKVIVDTNQKHRIVKVPPVRGRPNSTIEDEEVHGLYQASHLSVQEFCFATHLAKKINRGPTTAINHTTKTREVLISLLENYGNSFFHNAFSLLGELNDGQMPKMIQSHKSSRCSSGFLSNLLAIHSQNPSLKELDLGSNQNISDLNWCDNEEAVEGLQRLESLNLKNCTNITGNIPPVVLALMLEHQATLEGVGKMLLPNTCKIKGAPSKIVDRLSCANRLDLRHTRVLFETAGPIDGIFGGAFSNLTELNCAHLRELSGDLSPIANGLPNLRHLVLAGCVSLSGSRIVCGASTGLSPHYRSGSRFSSAADRAVRARRNYAVTRTPIGETEFDRP